MSDEEISQLKTRSVFYALDAEIFRRKRDFKSALFNINKAISMLPDYDMYYFTRHLIKLEIGDKKGAENDIKKAKKLNPGYNFEFNNV